MFTNDPFTARTRAFLSANRSTLTVSDFAAAELASTVARHTRTNQLSPAQAHSIFSNFDTWAARATERAETTTEDIVLAEAMLRRLDLNLRTPDAIHIAIARRLGTTLMTFDDRMARSANTLGLAVAEV